MRITSDMIENARPLLNFIARFESRGNYNIVWGGIRRQHKPPRPLTTMTVGEVLDWQDSIDRLYMSEAAGKYQIMEDTLRGLYRSAGMTLKSRFDEAGQDRLGTALLIRRGYDDYLEGRIGAVKFANALAKEWASLPVVSGPKAGRSYYAGDGLNAAHAGVEETLAAVVAAAAPDEALPPDVEPSEPPARPDPAEKREGGLWAVLAALLGRWFKRS